MSLIPLLISKMRSLGIRLVMAPVPWLTVISPSFQIFTDRSAWQFLARATSSGRVLGTDYCAPQISSVLSPRTLALLCGQSRIVLSSQSDIVHGDGSSMQMYPGVAAMDDHEGDEPATAH